MIYKTKGLDYETLWVDGYLPSQNKLRNIFSNQRGVKLNVDINDLDIIKGVESMSNRNYAERFPSITRPQAYIQILKPKSVDYIAGKTNQLQSEFVLDNTPRDNYRMFFMVSRDSFISNVLKDSFLDALESLNFEKKAEDDYYNKKNLEKYLTQLSDYFIERYFLPYQLIKNDLASLGFDSENAGVA